MSICLYLGTCPTNQLPRRLLWLVSLHDALHLCLCASWVTRLLLFILSFYSYNVWQALSSECYPKFSSQPASLKTHLNLTNHPLLNATYGLGSHYRANTAIYDFFWVIISGTASTWWAIEPTRFIKPHYRALVPTLSTNAIVGCLSVPICPCARQCYRYPSEGRKPAKQRQHAYERSDTQRRRKTAWDCRCAALGSC